MSQLANKKGEDAVLAAGKGVRIKGQLQARSLGRRSASFEDAQFSLAPEFSACQPLARWQRFILYVLILALCLGVLTVPRATLAVLLALLAVPFLCVVLLRTGALFFRLSRVQIAPHTTPIQDRDLPKYSVLVPLYDEAEIVSDLVEALKRIDYPIEKLDILLIVESADPKTCSAVFKTERPAHFRVHVVTTSPPQTKPHALNHALLCTDGDVVVVYDAEDMPDADQLRRAAALLYHDDEIGCVQACLNVYNPNESFLTRQFTIEYTALFDCLLPTLRSLGFPVPLGGTSNHFPRHVLEDLGGWDAYNVTEDADLGICLARAGYKVEILPATTWEEAPATFSIWLRQRTRWLKGWMQTYLVHMRRPARLHDELGTRGFLGLQVFMGGVLLSVLVHPWFYLLAALDLASGQGVLNPSSSHGSLLWWIAIFNLVAGYVAGVALGVAAVSARGWRRLAISSALMPIYWLLISVAAYRGLWQLLHAPFYWEKTAHRARDHSVAVAVTGRG